MSAFPAHAPGLSATALRPRPLLVLSVLSTLIAVFVAVVIARSSASNGDVTPVPVPADVQSVAYVVPGDWQDQFFVHSGGVDATPKLVATLPSSFGLHARGSASPMGDRAVLFSVSPSTSPYAGIRVFWSDGAIALTLAESADYLSPVAWSADGKRFAVRRTGASDDAGRAPVQVFEFDAASGATRAVANFDAVFDVAPLGYSSDGQKLYLAVVDQSGSSLWSVRGEKLQRVASLSPGRTRDWALSPDGSRVAFIEVLGVGEQSFAGRTLVIDSGAVSNVALAGNQLGAVWLPGESTAYFGGPGGSLQLTGSGDPGAFLVPYAWSPDGTTLAAVTYITSPDTGRRVESLELLRADLRIRLSDVVGTAFIGWVRNLD